ncbi:40S ribosomal protein S27 [Borealophlyctis nickersoniae]|nr:40S ribosomal protein S27 [Borealophlyctis nickersoniae]
MKSLTVGEEERGIEGAVGTGRWKDVKAMHERKLTNDCGTVGGKGQIWRLAVDLLNPLESTERRRHKLKRLVQSPNSYFMDVKCPGCFSITTVFSHAQTVVLCSSCSAVLCQPTGGKARLTEGSSFRKKAN